MKTLIMILALAVGAYSQVVVSGNPTCQSLGYTNGYRIDPPHAGTYVVDRVGSVTVTINTPTTFSWTSTQPPFVQGVIVKGGPNANYYAYPSGSSGADLLTTPNGAFGLSHIDFCYNLFATPTAGRVNVSGQVLDFYGRPVYGAIVTLTRAQTGEAQTARTNPFGYFVIEGVEVGELYQIQATAKGREFLPQTLSLKDEVTGLIIQALY